MYYSDNPIDISKEDKLDRSGFVDQLAKSIIDWKIERSLVLALYGSWGTGKSSTLNLLKEKLSSSKEYLAIADFDPWFFNSAEQLLRGFWKVFITTSEPILANDQKKRDKFKYLIRKYTNSLTFTPELSVGIFKFKLPGSTDFESPEKIKDELASSLSTATGKMVFLIDNLDRLDAQELVLVLKLIRLCSDLPNTVYILAFDKTQVENILKVRKDIDADYLDKIIQVDVHLPPIDKGQIEAIFLDGLNHLLDENKIRIEDNFSERFSTIFQKEIITNVLTDIRRTKRYLNGLGFSLPLVLGEVNYTDLILLEFLRIFSPGTYVQVPANKSDLIAFDSPTVGNDIFRNRKHARYKAFIDKIDEKDKYPSTSKLLLAELFPVFGAYLSNPINPTYITQDYMGREADRQLRITSQRHFDTYFRLQVSSSEIPVTELKRQIEEINELSKNLDSKQFPEYLNQLRNEHEFAELLSRLGVYSDNFTKAGKSLMIRQLVKLSDQFTWNPLVYLQDQK